MEEYAYDNSKLKLNCVCDDENYAKTPTILARLLDEKDILFASQLSYTNCELTDDNERIKLNIFEGGKTPSIKVNRGVLKGLTIIISPIYINQNTYQIDTNRMIIYRIKLHTQVREFKDIMADNTIKITNIEGTFLEDEEIIATGMKAIIDDKEYVLSVIGDVDGNREADFWDMLAINKHRLETETLGEIEILAGDVIGDGEADFWDMLEINKFRLGLINNL